ncbi:RrF2 family transcriptional regulator [Glycomyces harbinensis]|uniref:Transcriptional regulator, BadM/Rrf2 family n=1 Tax=Glycomyces harbinensis TaxID=58114 RepID=A0A1G6UV41_9ACTN|nr:Rrf2 family transcriptional regulator [Glycomyces harbinensis]SDD45202.1 transcriptional regulator, BadM/Rrf2 family [Glycomyces harbinensis]
MRLSARVDYALRAAVALAGYGDRWVSAEQIAEDQGIPRKFLESILLQLRRGGIAASKRGSEGGHQLARPGGEISLADVIRAVDGPLVGVRGERPEQVSYSGTATALTNVWIALRVSERNILESVSLAAVASDDLPTSVTKLLEDPDAWVIRGA